MPEPFRILVVCTGNICRSPMTQVLLIHRLRERLGRQAADEDFEVTSAGTYGLVGHPIDDSAAEVLSSYGVGAEPFEARELLVDHVEDADLVLGATREHRAAAVTLVPRASGRTFTLREFARLVAAADEPVDAPLSPPDRARALVRAAAGQRGLVRPDRPEDDDVDDPFRRSAQVFEQTGRDISAAVDAIVTRLACPARA